MNPAQFQKQMNRMIEQFGKSAYGTERCALIWRDVQDFSEIWWEKTVDYFIGEERQAPLMPQFRSQIAEERERLHKLQKQQHAKDAKSFFESAYHPDDERTICQFIVKRITGGVSDEDYSQFIKHLDYTPRANPSVTSIQNACSACNAAGIVFDKQNYIYRCYCEQGRKRLENYPIYQRETHRV